MGNIWKGITGVGGANRFFEKDGQLMVAGADVGGRQVVTLELLEDLFDVDITVKSTGSISGDDVSGRYQDNGLAVLGGSDVSGQYKFDLDFEDGVKNEEKSGEGIATILAHLATMQSDFDVFDFIDANRAEGELDKSEDKINDLDGAIDYFQNRIDNDKSTKFAGTGVSGDIQIDVGSNGQAFIDQVEELAGAQAAGVGLNALDALLLCDSIC